MKSTESSFGLSTQTIDALRGIFKKYSGIEKVILYGSRALGKFKAGSDIDLVLVAPTLGSLDLSKIETAIDDLLLPYSIDLSLLHCVENKALIDHIERVGIEFFRKS